MFGILSRGVAAFVASVSGNGQHKSEDIVSVDGIPGNSNNSEDGRSIKSSGTGKGGEVDGREMSRNQYDIERPQSANVEEMVQFLIDNFVPTEAILASLDIEKQEEVTLMLTDLVRDCVQCSSTCYVRDKETHLIDGICLASKATLFDMQIDRLCGYEFKNDRIVTAVDFLKYVFNRLDITYHFEENRISKPIFVALVSVRRNKLQQGIATALLDTCMAAAKDDRCDGAIALASNQKACKLISRKFPITIQSIRYDTFRGRHRTPPIVMKEDEPQRALYVMLSKF